jgi:predicted Zn-dependent protease
MSRRLLLPLPAVLALALLPVGCEGVDLSGLPYGQYVQTAARVGKAGARASEDFTPEQEYYIGRAVGATLLERYPPVTDGAATLYVNQLGQALAQASDLPETFGGYRFVLLASDEVNAFATPGGLVLLTRGLVDCCRCEDDLAAVLAHEIAHVQLQHGIGAVKASRRREVGKVIFSEASSYAGGDAGRLMDLFDGTVMDVVNQLAEGSYSRTQELAADAAAVELLQRVGYDPAGLGRVLRSMEKRFGRDSGGFAESHPDPAVRLEALPPAAQRSGMPSQPAARAERFRAFAAAL